VIKEDEMQDNIEQVKTVEQLNKEYDQFFDQLLRFLGHREFFSLRDCIRRDELSKESIDNLVEKFLEYMGIENFEGWHSDERKNEIKNEKARLLIVTEKIAKFLTATKKDLEEKLLDMGRAEPMIGTTEFSVRVFTDGIKKEIDSFDLEAHIRQQEQLTIVQGLKAVKGD
jgi:hypothetical protein